jgi:sigma-B regulation protein RsbU (phosphoserine phosphatase)
MKLRTKLLLLLLLVSVVPTLVIGFISVYSMADLGAELADDTAIVLLENAKTQLQEIVDENGKIIGLGTIQLDMVVRVQQIAAARALSVENPPEQKTYSVSSFDTPETAPGDLQIVSMFDGRLLDGTIVSSPVSYETQVIIRSEGVPDAIAKKESNQLQSMNKLYQAISMEPGLPASRYFTSTVNGMGGTFPGHGRMPKGYDPRERDWYTLALTSNGEVMHTLPKIDASTLRFVVASVAPIFAQDGTLLGVTGAERFMMDLLHEISIPEVWRAEAVVRVIIPEDNAFTVVASQSMEEGIIDWNGQVEQQQFQDTSEDFQKLYKRVKSSTVGVMDYVANNKLFVVAYAPIVGMKASLVVWVPHDVIASKAMAKEKILNEKTAVNALIIVIFSAVVVLVVLVISLLVSQMVSRPIMQLTKATASIALGNFDVEVKNCGADEIGDLTRHFNGMIPKLKERLAMQDSLEVAKQIQQCLLPSENPTFEGWNIAGKSMYCDATGGDYYDFIFTKCGTVLRLVLGDVTGHGIASALMMATARSLLRGGLQSVEDPALQLHDVNNALVDDTPLGWFMTFYCLELCAKSGEARWVSAGHDPAILVSANGVVSELAGNDIPLGVNANWSFTNMGPQIIESGSVLVLGTDGIWEAWNEQHDEMFGKERLIKVIIANRAKPPAEICNAICDAVLAFCGAAPRTDDITLIVAQRP